MEVSLSCTELVNLDIWSKSDPMCVLSVKKSGKWVELGRTETIYDDLTPQFAKSFVLEYRFEEQQHIKVAVFDVDSHSHDLTKHDFIGETEFTLAELVAAGQTLVKSLYRLGNPKVRGKLHVSCEEMAESKFNINFQMRAEKLDKKDWFGKSDLYIEIGRGKEDGSFTMVWRTEVVRRTLNPSWTAFEISSQKLCNGDYDRPLQFTCCDRDRNSSPNLVGLSTTSLRSLLDNMQAGREPHLQLIEPAMQQKKGHKYQNSGILHIMRCEAVPVPTFVDYLRGGCNVSLMIGIDFTASNRDPKHPNSLHYTGTEYFQENEYTEAIRTVGDVLADYDSDQLFPVWGFGAKLCQSDEVSHCFPLNSNPADPKVRGVQGVLDLYKFCLSSIALHGPTVFTPLLRSVVQEIGKKPCMQQDQNYYILLIITDGVIHDMQNTIDLIVESSTLPLSIVIVGVGHANFQDMEVLDADNAPLKARNGQYMSRDIVQFVPLQQFKKQREGQFSLAQEVLAEIPGQLTSFMKSKGIVPNSSGLEQMHFTDRQVDLSDSTAYTVGPQMPHPHAGASSIHPQPVSPLL